MAAQAKKPIAEIVGFLTNAGNAVGAMVKAQADGRESMKKTREAVKAAVEVHRAELNLNLKAAKLAGWKWTGTAKTNSGIKALMDSQTQQGLEKGSVANNLSAMKNFYNGGKNGYEVTDLNPSRFKEKTRHIDLIDGKVIKLAAADIPCTESLILSLDREGFGAIALGVFETLGVDVKTVKKADEKIIAAFKSTLVAKGYAVLDAKGKLTVKK